MTLNVVRLDQILSRLGISRTGLRNMMIRGEFPRPTGKLGRNLVWPTTALDDYMARLNGQKVPE